MSHILLNYDQPLPTLEGSLNIATHFHEHHLVYQKKYNELIQKHKEFEGLTVQEVLSYTWQAKQKNNASSEMIKIFRNGLQAINHEKFWDSLKRFCTPIENFPISEQDFIEAGTEHFASGWLWLIEIDGVIDLCCTSNEQSIEFHSDDLCTFKHKIKVNTNVKELAVYDLWEHSYYLDYTSSRSEYLRQIFKNMINWDHIRNNMGNLISEYEKNDSF